MRKWAKSAQHAIRGIYLFFKSERNGRIQLGLLAVVVLAGLYFGINRNEWIVLILTSSLVLGLEMVNASLEKALDLLHPDISPKVKTIKDIAAGSVLIASIAALVIGFLIFLPYLLKVFAAT